MVLTRQQKIMLVAGAVVVLIISGYYLIKSMPGDEIIFNAEPKPEGVAPALSARPSARSIVVYIMGAVKNEGVVKLKAGSRLFDAVTAVGGLTKNADLSKINLAAKVKDGQKIEIPSQALFHSRLAAKNLVSFKAKLSQINVNVATAGELQKVKGIGEKMSREIVKYRKEHGKFTNLIELKKVKGIGDVKFNKIKNFLYLQ